MRHDLFFDKAYSTGSWTIPAHGSLFTGKLPSEHGAHAKQKFLETKPEDTLSGKLSKIGYNSVGFSTNPWITDEFGFTTGFNNFHEIYPNLPFSDKESDPRNQLNDPNAQKIFQWIFSGNPFKRVINGVYAKYFKSLPYAPADMMTKNITNWMSESSEQPFFIFANYMDAHEPYISKKRDIDGDVLDFEWNLHCYENGPDPNNHKEIQSIYDSSISYLDRNLRKLIDSLDLNNTLLITLGDHGQSLGENNYWGHGTHLSEELIHVPLIINSPTDFCSLDPSDIISLRDVPNLIFEYLNIHCDENIMPSNHRTCDTIIAESFGPHQEVDSIPDSIPESGYRVIMNNKGHLLRNLDEDNSEFTPIINQAENEKIRSELLEIEAETFENIETNGLNEQKEIEKGTQERLKDLGYL